jgi:hypothetical protein
MASRADRDLVLDVGVVAVNRLPVGFQRDRVKRARIGDHCPSDEEAALIGQGNRSVPPVWLRAMPVPVCVRGRQAVARTHEGHRCRRRSRHGQKTPPAQARLHTPALPWIR